MFARHEGPLSYTEKTGNITTNCDATNPALAVKKSLSPPKSRNGEPAKQAAKSADPGNRRGPAISFPDLDPQASRSRNLAPHPPTLHRPSALTFRDLTIRHLGLRILLRWLPLHIAMAFRGVLGLPLHSHECLQNKENGVLSSRGRPESGRIEHVKHAKH